MKSRDFDIFLSYKSEDHPWVRTLKENLVKRGVRVWLDSDQIRPGDLCAKALENGIATSSAVGLVVTPESVASGWVREEYYRGLSLATKGELQLIPILLRKAEMPGFLSGRQYVDVTDPVHYERAVDNSSGQESQAGTSCSCPFTLVMVFLGRSYVKKCGILVFTD